MEQEEQEKRIWDHYPILARRYAGLHHGIGLRIHVMLLADPKKTIAFRTEIQLPSGQWEPREGTLSRGFQSGVLMEEFARCILELRELSMRDIS